MIVWGWVRDDTLPYGIATAVYESQTWLSSYFDGSFCIYTTLYVWAAR